MLRSSRSPRGVSEFRCRLIHALRGETDKAEAMLQRAVAIAGPLGLFAEAVDARDKFFGTICAQSCLGGAKPILRCVTTAASPVERFAQRKQMSLGTILLIILILILIGALPTWPYSSGWGYYPSGGLGLILVIVIILLLLGRI